MDVDDSEHSCERVKEVVWAMKCTDALLRQAIDDALVRALAAGLVESPNGSLDVVVRPRRLAIVLLLI